MVWYGMVWYGMVWYGMVWYVWYGMISTHNHHKIHDILFFLGLDGKNNIFENKYVIYFNFENPGYLYIT
jgi:hypothetical protein